MDDVSQVKGLAAIGRKYLDDVAERDVALCEVAIGHWNGSPGFKG